MDREIAKGKFLIAMPVLNDPNFRQTVVLLCEHGPEGSLGLVVNRPTDLEVSNLLESFPDLSAARLPDGQGQAGFPGSGWMHSGGPVNQNGMLILCRREDEPQNQGILKDVFLITDLAELKRTGEAAADYRMFRFYLGYAGWAPGQLEAEMKAGAWRLIAGDAGLIFNENPCAVWQETMRRMGREWTIYASMPPDLSSN